MIIHGFQVRNSMPLHFSAGSRQLESCGPQARRFLCFSHRRNHGQRKCKSLHAQFYFPLRDSINFHSWRTGMGGPLRAVSESRKQQISDAILGQGKDNDDSWFFTETGQKSLVRSFNRIFEACLVFE